MPPDVELRRGCGVQSGLQSTSSVSDEQQRAMTIARLQAQLQVGFDLPELPVREHAQFIVAQLPHGPQARDAKIRALEAASEGTAQQPELARQGSKRTAARARQPAPNDLDEAEVCALLLWRVARAASREVLRLLPTMQVDLDQLQNSFQAARQSASAAQKRAEGLQAELSSVLSQLQVGAVRQQGCSLCGVKQPEHVLLQAVQSSAAEEIQALRHKLRVHGALDESGSIASQPRSACNCIMQYAAPTTTKALSSLASSSAAIDVAK